MHERQNAAVDREDILEAQDLGGAAALVAVFLSRPAAVRRLQILHSDPPKGCLLRLSPGYRQSEENADTGAGLVSQARLHRAARMEASTEAIGDLQTSTPGR